LSFFSLLLVFQSCSKSVTYADKLADEKKAIDRYIKKNNIKVISFNQFVENDSVTHIDKNEYVELQTGLYMQIVERGSENPVDTFANRDEITIRFSEYSIMDGYFTAVGNLDMTDFVDAFIYTISNNNTIKGEFVDRGNMIEIYGTKTVPSGWLIPLKYLRYNARVNLIVSSKLGHMNSLQQVYPYAYEIRRLGLSKR